MLSVVIPIRDEASSIPELISRLDTALSSTGRAYEVIFVNDGSVDGSGQILRKHCALDPHLKAIHLHRSQGQTAAMMAGFDYASGSVIVGIDGDLQNDPADIPVLISKLDEGFDLVSGWRRDRRDHPIRRNLLSRIANGLISWTTGVHLHDYGCSLKAYRREVLNGVRLYGEMHRFIPVYAHWNGARIAEVPVRHYPRAHGASKYGLERVVKVVLDLSVVLFLHRYAQKPIYIFGLFGLLSWAISFAAGVMAVIYKVLDQKSFIQTPLPLICMSLFFLGAVCFLLGLLAELSIRTYHESQGKPTYLIGSTDNLNTAVVRLQGRTPSA